MSENVKIALILAATLVVAEGLWIFFPPYQGCVRAFGDPRGAVNCAAIVSPKASSN